MRIVLSKPNREALKSSELNYCDGLATPSRLLLTQTETPGGVDKGHRRRRQIRKIAPRGQRGGITGRKAVADRSARSTGQRGQTWPNAVRRPNGFHRPQLVLPRCEMDNTRPVNRSEPCRRAYRRGACPVWQRIGHNQPLDGLDK